jgi:hypothetical protein
MVTPARGVFEQADKRKAGYFVTPDACRFRQCPMQQPARAIVKTRKLSGL